MKFNDEGIIISLKKYGENSLLLKVFSKNHGIFSGFVKSAKSSKDKALFQIGNLISFEYRNRIEENLGQFFYLDLVKSYSSQFIFDKLKLDCIKSLFSIINAAFLERESQTFLFERLHSFLEQITQETFHKNEILSSYIKLELKILQTIGYGLDLSCCAVTNQSDDLVFVSPKSARAVCLEAGKPYQSRLLKLPRFLVNDNESPTASCIKEGLTLSGFFLEKFLFSEKSPESSQQYFSCRKNITAN